jgi:sugar/nucleoside kinase (ribokinase family)
MESRQFDIYGIGNAIVDLQLSVPEAAIVELGLRKATMQLVDINQQMKLLDYFKGSDLTRSSGGSVANSMIAASQLGAKVAYGTVVGDDHFGEFYREELQQLGVVTHNQGIKDHVTGTSLILITPDAERTMNTHLGASQLLNATHLSEQYIKGSKWIFIEGYLLSQAGGQEAARTALKLAKKHGTMVALTFSDIFIVEIFGDILRELVPQCDLVFANLNEAKAYTKTSTAEESFDKLSAEVKNVIMTRSADGAWAKVGGLIEKVPAFKADAIDDTGAGDMFAGSFLFALTHHWPLKESILLGCFLAGKIVEQRGARILTPPLELLRNEPAFRDRF